jgi:hypothetical protein
VKDVIHGTCLNAERKAMIIVPGAGGVSVAANGLEGVYAMDWARNIRADSVLRSTEALMSRRVVRHPHPATTRTRLNMLERLLRTYFVLTSYIRRPQ